MKSVTYKKNGKGEIMAINPKVKENPMNSIPYEPQNSLWPDYPGIWKNGIKGIPFKPIVINRNKKEKTELKENFLLAYHVIQKELFKYTFNLENLHDAFLSILNRLEKSTIDLKENTPLHYLKVACSNRQKDEKRSIVKLDLFKEVLTKKIESSNDGITNEFISMLFDEIKAILKEKEYNAFILFHVKGYSQSKIAKELNINQSTISRLMERVNDKIDRLNISYLYDGRYVDYTNKSKHNHISSHERSERSNLVDKENKMQFDGICFKVDKSNYIPQKKESIDYTNLKHTYGKWTCKKEIKIENFGYTQIAENYTMHKISGIVKGVYSESDIIGMPKSIDWKERSKREYKYYSKGISNYKLKKLKRQFSGKSNMQKKIDRYQIYLKYGRYLEFMDD